MTYPGDLLAALLVLRSVRSLTQVEPAKAAGLRNSASISDYERGKKLPELRTLQALLGAMSFTPSTLEAVMAFVRELRGEPSAEATEKRLRGEALGAAFRLASGLLALAGPSAEPRERT